MRQLGVETYTTNIVHNAELDTQACVTEIPLKIQTNTLYCSIYCTLPYKLAFFFFPPKTMEARKHPTFIKILNKECHKENAVEECKCHIDSEQVSYVTHNGKPYAAYESVTCH